MVIFTFDFFSTCSSALDNTLYMYLPVMGPGSWGLFKKICGKMKLKGKFSDTAIKPLGIAAAHVESLDMSPGSIWIPASCWYAFWRQQMMVQGWVSVPTWKIQMEFLAAGFTPVESLPLWANVGMWREYTSGWKTCLCLSKKFFTRDVYFGARQTGNCIVFNKKWTMWKKLCLN